MAWSVIPVAAGLAVGCTLASGTLMHWFQLESYQLPGYFRSLRRKWKEALLPGLMLAPLAGVLRFGLEAGAWWQRLLGGALLAFFGWAVGRLTRVDGAKKKFAVTARVKRLGGAMILVCFLLLLPGFWNGWRWLFPLALPLILALSALVIRPVERCIYELYFQDARRKLKARPDLVRIGITGSYGKTSVKFILNTMLSVKFQVLTTPSSFNTPMGLTRVIREKLDPAHQIFLAEMGARHRRDIRELCRLVHPNHGVLVSVGPQHLDTFGSIDAIRETKYDLIRAVPEDGCRFFPDDGAICRELYDRTEGKKRLVCTHPEDAADVWAEGIEVTPRGSLFTLCTRTGQIRCETKLLGAHSIQNLLLAASVCLELGMSLRQVQQGMALVQPVEHRLQLIEQAGGITLIDDAFNSNPRGAAAALEVLKAFPPRRIIVTPGMVELGPEEAAYNRAFGEQMADCADVAILVGPRHTAPIREGLLSKGFPEDQIRTVASLAEAAQVMRGMAKPGDTVMFENDLPDNYSEAG